MAKAPKTRITVDEWLAELTKLEAEAPKGFTTQELADQLGVCLATARLKLRDWHRAGRIVYTGVRRTVNIAGRASTTPVYRVVKRPR